ncbi:MAG: Uma2 family endonuclease [Cyanobacteria bacterium P01_C01_bin.118]
MTWADYEQLVSEDYAGYRVLYWQGNITIMSPGRNHERIAETINGLVKTYCRKHNLVYFSIGSTTLKNPPLAGKEPDCSF